MQTVKEPARRQAAKVLSIAGGSLLTIDLGPQAGLAVISNPFPLFGVLVIVMNIVARDRNTLRTIEIFSSLCSSAFTAALVTVTYSELVRHDTLEKLPELYAITALLSLGCTLVFEAGVLDFRKPHLKSEPNTVLG